MLLFMFTRYINYIYRDKTIEHKLIFLLSINFEKLNSVTGSFLAPGEFNQIAPNATYIF